MLKLDFFITVGALIVAALFFWNSEHRFNLFFFETNWVWFSIISLFVMEIPFFALFVNRNDVDFSSAADMPAAQDVELLEDIEAQYAADYPLKQHKFSGVESITIFVADSFGGDLSRISFLGFKGTGTGINYRDQAEIVYESRAQLKDHKTPAAEQGAR